MTRLVVPAALLLAFPAAAAAQPFRPQIQQSGFGGGFQPTARPTPLPALPSAPRYAGGFLGGFVQPGYTGPGFPFSGVWGGGYGWGGWGGWLPFYTYPAPLYVSPFEPPNNALPARPLVGRPEPTITLANEFPATLTLELPAAAEVWVGGKKADGAAAAEWTLTSPTLKAGESHKFEVRARWSSGGKTYEAERTVEVASGNRSRVLVVAGTPVKE